MEKRISYSQFQSVKSVARACDPLIVKRDKIKAKLAALTQEYDAYNMQITSLEAGIKAIIGFRVEELVKKVVESGIDANGQPKKTTKYLPTDIVSYDEDKKQFVITVPNEGEIADAEFETKEETPSPSTPAGDEDTFSKDEDVPQMLIASDNEYKGESNIAASDNISIFE